jgi:hypothetical protein
MGSVQAKGVAHRSQARPEGRRPYILPGTQRDGTIYNTKQQDDVAI